MAHIKLSDYWLPQRSDLCHHLCQPLFPVFPTLPDTLQLCSIHLHFPVSKDCNWFLTLFPDVPSLPTQLPARVNPLCRGKAKHWQGADRRASPGALEGIGPVRCIVLTNCSSLLSLSLSLSFLYLLSSLRCQRWAVCHRDAPSTGRCRTRACAATARAPPMPARTAPCLTKPCLTTSYLAPPHLTTVRCLLAWFTTREHPTWGVSTDSHLASLEQKKPRYTRYQDITFSRKDDLQIYGENN